LGSTAASKPAAAWTNVRTGIIAEDETRSAVLAGLPGSRNAAISGGDRLTGVLPAALPMATLPFFAEGVFQCKRQVTTLTLWVELCRLTSSSRS